MSNGQIEFADNAPAMADLTQGVYRGYYNSATRVFSGQYFEYRESTNELLYVGEWSATR